MRALPPRDAKGRFVARPSAALTPTRTRVLPCRDERGACAFCRRATRGAGSSRSPPRMRRAGTCSVRRSTGSERGGCEAALMRRAAGAGTSSTAGREGCAPTPSPDRLGGDRDLDVADRVRRPRWLARPPSGETASLGRVLRERARDRERDRRAPSIIRGRGRPRPKSPAVHRACYVHGSIAINAG